MGVGGELIKPEMKKKCRFFLLGLFDLTNKTIIFLPAM